jgi:predicted dehydrogenase
MNKKIHIGVIGLGYGAYMHLPVYQSLHDVEVIAVADSGLNKPSETIRNSDYIGKYSSWKEIINDRKIDAVSIAVPPFAQKEIVCAALSAGKHVLCEKPFGKNFAEAKEMYEFDKDSSLVNAVGFQFRMEPGINILKREIQNEAIGEILHIDVTWLTGGGVISGNKWSWKNDRDKGGGVLGGFVSHVLDYVQWMTNSEISTVNASSKTLIPFRYDSDGISKKVTAEDSFDILCCLSNGASVNMRVSNCYKYALGHRIEVYGTSGKISFLHRMPYSLDDITIEIETESSGVGFIDLKEYGDKMDVETRFIAFKKMAVLFINAIRGVGTTEMPTFYTGMQIQNIMYAIMQSITKGCQTNISNLCNPD